MDKDIAQLLLRLSNKINMLSKQARAFGTGELLYSSEIHTIVVIGKNPGINLTQLSSKMGVSKSATFKFIKKVSQKGYIIKSKSFENQKEVIFNITEKGRIAYLNHEKYSTQRFEKVYQTFSNRPYEEQSVIVDFMDEIHKDLEALE